MLHISKVEKELARSKKGIASQLEQQAKTVAENEATVAKLRKQLAAAQKAVSDAETETARVQKEAAKAKAQAKSEVASARTDTDAEIARVKSEADAEIARAKEELEHMRAEAERTKDEAANAGAGATQEVEKLRARLLLVERELVEAEEVHTDEAERAASLLSFAEKRASEAESRLQAISSEVDSLRQDLQRATQQALDERNAAATSRWQAVLAADAASAAEARAKALAETAPASTTELLVARNEAAQGRAELADSQRELSYATDIAEQQLKRIHELEAALRDARADALANIAIVEATEELARNAVAAAKIEATSSQTPKEMLERIYEMARSSQEARDALVEYVSTLPLIQARSNFFAFHFCVIHFFKTNAYTPVPSPGTRDATQERARSSRRPERAARRRSEG